MPSGRAYRQPATYQIRVRGDLGKLSQSFDGLTITHQASGEALLTGTVVDQDALHRLLRSINDSGVSVRYLQIAETNLTQARSPRRERDMAV